MKQLLRIYSLKTGKVLLAPVYTNGVSVKAYHQIIMYAKGYICRSSINAERENYFYDSGYRMNHIIFISTKQIIRSPLLIKHKETI